MRNSAVIVIREVPGEICDTCGEAYHSEEVTSSLLKKAEQAYCAEIDVEVRHYQEAT
ncbi:MAG: YgiT-type zinc finger protein [Candidatus Contendobacter sp.]|nr:YgiT-type zinc finger protein [Candidatus Contendobacter sp.]RUQ38582.1 MAG: YgiT-type zinc finger protein [Candidatus Competibacteraceae bacterium]